MNTAKDIARWIREGRTVQHMTVAAGSDALQATINKRKTPPAPSAAPQATAAQGAAPEETSPVSPDQRAASGAGDLMPDLPAHLRRARR